jgi:hypothetical protein
VIRIIIADDDGTRALLDARQPISIVVSLGHTRLSSHGHGGPTTSVVVGTHCFTWW